MKLVHNYDEVRKNAESGVDQKPLTETVMTAHLAEFGIHKSLAQRKIRWLSGGQRCRLVLAAAMWTMPVFTKGVSFLLEYVL